MSARLLLELATLGSARGLALGSAAPSHTVINGRSVVEEGVLLNPDYADRRRRHDAITAQWQQVVDGG